MDKNKDNNNAKEKEIEIKIKEIRDKIPDIEPVSEMIKHSIFKQLHESSKEILDFIEAHKEAYSFFENPKDKEPQLKEFIFNLNKKDFENAGIEYTDKIENALKESKEKDDYLIFYDAFEVIEGIYLLVKIYEIKNGIKSNQKDEKNIKTERITAVKVKKTEYPVDKVNSDIWKLLESDQGGQITFAMEKKGSDKELNLFYSINFDKLDELGIKITRKLSIFDKRVYIAMSSLFNAGASVVTYSQIHKAMGNNGKPSDNQLKKIRESVLKMFKAQIYIDNKQEAETYKKYGRFLYTGDLLPIEIVDKIEMNGKITENAIHLFREPPLITFAKQRKQITTIDIGVLQAPVSKTDANLLLEDYLIERIARASIKKAPNKILFETLYKEAEITTKKQRSRLPEKLKRYLDHFVETGFISNYRLNDDSITVYFEK